MKNHSLLFRSCLKESQFHSSMQKVVFSPQELPHCVCVCVFPHGNDPRRQCLLKSLDVTAAHSVSCNTATSFLVSPLWSSVTRAFFDHFSRDSAAWTLHITEVLSPHANSSADDSVTQDSFLVGTLAVPFPFKMLLFLGQAIYVFSL